jgi:hypothetical protein
MDPFQAELREFIRRLNINDDRINVVTRQTYALAQGINDLFADGRVNGGYCLTEIHGKIAGCGGVTALPNATLHLVNSSSGADYGTFPVATGNYSISIIIDPADSGAINGFAGGPGVRWTTSTAWTLNAGARCGTNNQSTIAPTAATGYGCFTGLSCLFPVANSLTLIDSVYGTVTVNRSGATWTGANATVSYSVDAGSGNITVFKTPGSVVISSTSITSKVCPDAGTTKLDTTYTFGVSGTIYPAGGTIRLFEP